MYRNVLYCSIWFYTVSVYGTQRVLDQPPAVAGGSQEATTPSRQQLLHGSDPRRMGSSSWRLPPGSEGTAWTLTTTLPGGLTQRPSQLVIVREFQNNTNDANDSQPTKRSCIDSLGRNQLFHSSLAARLVRQIALPGATPEQCAITWLSHREYLNSTLIVP